MDLITIADIESESIDRETLIQITDKENLGVVNEVAVNGRISSVSGVIEDMLRARYPVPFDSVPAIIRDIALKMTAYEIYGLNKTFPRPEGVKDDYTNAMKLLTRISTGDIKLGIVDRTGEVPATKSSVSVSGPDRVFSRDKMRGL